MDQRVRSTIAGRVVAGLLLVLALSACGEGERAESAALRVTTTAQRAWRTGDSEPVARLEVPEALEPWTATAVRQSIEQRPADEGGQRVVVLGAQKAKTLRIPLDSELPAFNQVRCKLIMLKNSSVSVDLLSEGRVLARTPYSLVIGGEAPQSISIDVKAARYLKLRPDELVLRFAGGARWVRCWDISLAQVPWENWAADYAGGRGRPVVGDTAREGAAIATDNPRRTEFVVPRDGRMSFHFAMAPDLSLPHAEAILSVKVTGSSNRLLPVLELQVAKGKRDALRWQHGSLDLSDLEGETVRVDFSLRSKAALVDCALLSTVEVFSAISKPRTVLFVTSDTHRADHVASLRGAVDVQTPTLDALGARGVIFDDCYSSTNITVPSHVSLLTALPPRDTGVLDNMSGIAEEAHTVADSFRSAGWATLAAVSGSQLQDAWSGLGQGFDAMACPQTMTWDGAETLARLRELLPAAQGRDLFVWVHLFDVHRPYDTDSPYLALYYPEDRDPYDPALPEPPFPRGIMNDQQEGLRDAEFMDAGYKAEVTYTDWVLSQLFEIPRLAQGVIAVTADHGECLGEYDVWWDHAGLYPENLRVPMLLAGPGVPAGARVAGPVQHLDLGRTLLDLAGLEELPFPGETMLRHLELDPPRETPRFALAAGAQSASLELGGWFCALNLRGWKIRGMDSVKRPHSVELYDLRPGGDPLRDVAHEDLERARRMRELILDWLANQSSTGWVQQDQANDAARIDQVRALGYTTAATDGSTIWVDPECDCEPCGLFRR